MPHNTFPADCGICHIPDRWDVLRDDFSFDHEKETGYRLEGAHAEAACLRCHNDRGPVTVYVARGCGGCHPDPHASSLGLECQRCHDQRTWEPTGLIAEHIQTRFPLYGTHAVTPCESCHPGASAGQFRGAPIECELCHQADLAQATSPDHAANGWVADCQRCHTATMWTRASVPHDAFPLVGGHAGLDCTQCHTSGTFETIPSDCYVCHQTDYESAPDHVTQSFSQNCQECHSVAAWTPASYDHTNFPLTGGHTGLNCVQCHTSGSFGTIPADCYACHSTDYAGADDHISQSFSQDCELCHNTSAWVPTTFDHTGFLLTGGHTGLNCIQCHTGGVSGPVSSDCYSCHSTDYAGAPDHVSQGFSQNCQQCHSTVAWTPATYDHSSFALTGGHAGLNCTQCHTSGTFGTIPSDCYSCHSTDYTGAADHASLGFPQNCEQCHTTSAWTPATFSHDFPLSGDHDLSCASCHTSGTTSSFSCIDCHAHTQSEMNEEHDDVRNYSYNSQACYSCHPNGRE